MYSFSGQILKEELSLPTCKPVKYSYDEEGLNSERKHFDKWIQTTHTEFPLPQIFNNFKR